MRRRATLAVLCTLSMFGLAACEDGLPFGATGDGEEGAAVVPSAPEKGVRDVERPDIFSTTENALWDGRPSLGGIWVAHPDVTDPERAIIRNETNGQSIAGALFRRERTSPGPKLQLSSDAAAALNVLAGKPTEVSVVVVRQEEFEVEPPAPVLSEEEVGEGEDPGDADPAIAAAATAAAVDGAEATPERPRNNFLNRLFSRRAQEPEEPALEATAESAETPEVETATLDPVAASAAAAIDRAEEAEPPTPRPASAPANSLRNPFVQVGLFSVEQNARDAATSLREVGIVPTLLSGKLSGEPVWRVVVGPMTSADDQDAVLEQVRNLGYADAFLAPQ